MPTGAQQGTGGGRRCTAGDRGRPPVLRPRSSSPAAQTLQRPPPVTRGLAGHQRQPPPGRPNLCTPDLGQGNVTP